ncbi:cytochrome b5 [Colletotrichum higginsianum]|uniref:Cytochrome b5 n=1 Tax=Colletotrichum higginsianum (strain IMI 349063) TaxID=759273 RepID=H1V6K7_COLHI|nr:cytochrome b5 [Colletotrichum higginsianum]
MATTEGPEFTAKEVAAHREANDCWMVIHGEGMALARRSR